MSHRIGPLALVGVVGLLLVVVVALFWFAFLPQRLHARLATLAETEMALGVAHTGPARLAWANGPEARIHGIRISDASLAGAFTAEAESLHVAMSPAQMLGFAGDVPPLTLENATITLNVAAAMGGATAAGSKSNLAGGAPGLAPVTLRLADSNLVLTHPGDGLRLSLADVNGTVTLDAERQLNVHVTGLLNGVFTTLRLEVEQSGRLASDGSPADILLSSDRGELRFSGRFGWGKGLVLDGRMAAASRRSNDLLSWLGLPSVLAPAAAIDAESGFSLHQARAAFPDLTLSLGKSRATGRLTLGQQQNGLTVDGVLHGEDIDLASLWPAPESSGGWHDTPFSFLPWRPITGQIQLNARRLTLAGQSFDGAQITGRLALDEASFTLSSARGDMAALTISNSVPTRATAKAEVKTADAAAMAASLFGGRWLKGEISGTADLSATGNSWAGLVSSLAGDFSATLEEASLERHSLTDHLATAGQGWQTSASGGTARLSASLSGSVNEGVVTLSASEVVADGTRLAVAGEIDLLRQDLALEVRPRSGRKLPPRTGVKGPWTGPAFGKDVASNATPEAATAN